MIGALMAAFRFVRRHPLPAFGLYLLNGAAVRRCCSRSTRWWRPARDGGWVAVGWGSSSTEAVPAGPPGAEAHVLRVGDVAVPGAARARRVRGGAAAGVARVAGRRVNCATTPATARAGARNLGARSTLEVTDATGRPRSSWLRDGGARFGGRGRPGAGRARPRAGGAAPPAPHPVRGRRHQPRAHQQPGDGASLRGGGELVFVYAQEPDLLAEFTKRFPQAKVARSEAEILEDPSIQLVVSAIIPDERAPLGVRVMQHGKDYMSDKPGITTLEQLAEVAPRAGARPGRIYSIMYSERLENRATVRAGELVRRRRHRPRRPDDRPRPAPHQPQHPPGLVLRQGALRRHPVRHRVAPGRPVPVLHRTRRAPRWSPRRSANVHHPQYPKFEDFGDMMVRGNGGARLHPRGLVHAGRPGHLGRRPAHDPRHRRLHRDPQEHRHRRTPGRQPPVPGRPQGDALHRLPRGGAALRRAAGGRRAEPDRDGDAAGPLLPGGASWCSRRSSRRRHGQAHVPEGGRRLPRHRPRVGDGAPGA